MNFRRSGNENFFGNYVPENKKEEKKAEILLSAKSAYVFDVSRKTSFFELNPDAQLPLASLTKIMTAIIVEENIIPEVIITKEAILQEGDDGFIVGEKWQTRDLLDAMLISSSNDAAFALSSAVENYFGKNFVSIMNEKAKELGLQKTIFSNSTGLDLNKNLAGAYGSAKDVSNILLYALTSRPSLMNATFFKSMNINSKNFKNTNKLVNDLPGFLIGKTGYSDLAGGNLAIVVDKGYQRPFIIIVLGSTYEGRFDDVKTLYNLIP